MLLDPCVSLYFKIGISLGLLSFPNVDEAEFISNYLLGINDFTVVTLYRTATVKYFPHGLCLYIFQADGPVFSENGSQKVFVIFITPNFETGCTKGVH